MTRSPDGLDLPETLSAGPGLADRLRRLAHGHPSSPHAADGSARPPVTVPRGTDFPPDSQPRQSQGSRDGVTQAVRDGDPDIALTQRCGELAGPGSQAEPFTDAQWAEHVREVRNSLLKAHEAGLATDDLYTVEPDHEVWSADREAFHDEIVKDMYTKSGSVPNEHRAVIAGGLPGSGKTTLLGKQAGIDTSQFLMVNPDDVKAELAKRSLVPWVPGLSPMEASDLAHEESSHIAKRLAMRAQSDGKNIIWDITMSSLETTRARIQELREHGYTHIEGVFVDLPPEVSAARAESRHRHGEEMYRVGEGQGGRFIPTESILAKADPDWGSVNRRTFEAIKPLLDAWSVYDNSVNGRPAVLVDCWPPRRGTHE